MVKLTKKQKQQRKVIRRLNVCIDPNAVQRALTYKDIVNLEQATNDALLVYFEGRFDLGDEKNEGVIIDCTPREKDIRRAYPDGQTPREGWLNAENKANLLQSKIQEFGRILKLRYETHGKGSQNQVTQIRGDEAGVIFGFFKTIFLSNDEKMAEYPTKIEVADKAPVEATGQSEHGNVVEGVEFFVNRGPSEPNDPPGGTGLGSNESLKTDTTTAEDLSDLRVRIKQFLNTLAEWLTQYRDSSVEEDNWLLDQYKTTFEDILSGVKVKIRPTEHYRERTNEKAEIRKKVVEAIRDCTEVLEDDENPNPDELNIRGQKSAYQCVLNWLNGK